MKKASDKKTNETIRNVSGFSRTIYKLHQETKPSQEEFLDPWSSLRPSFLIKKISRDIMGFFKNKGGAPDFDGCFRLKNGSIDLDQVYDRWALLFPARTYLPPDYPHLQLWYLTKRFDPSLKSIPDKEVGLLASISSLMAEKYQDYASMGKKGSFAFGFNSTPFSFIRNKEGRYYSGGESVRLFHAHFLLFPPKEKMYKFRVNKKDLYLVYPTDFSRELFKIIANSKKIVDQVFGKMKPKVGERGFEFSYPLSGDLDTDMKKLWYFFKRLDDLFSRIELMLIHSFYQGGDEFIAEVEKFIKTKDVTENQDELSRLILAGKEREIGQIRSFLKKGLERVAADYQAELESSDLERLANGLTINEEGDISSFVFGEKKVLRPGMGYGCLVILKKNHFEVMINPLDILGSKGLMESSGYWVKKKIISHQPPSWLRFMMAGFQASC